MIKGTPIHFDIRIQGTPGKALMAVVRDLDGNRDIVVPQPRVMAKTLTDIFELCQSVIEARLRAREGNGNGKRNTRASN